MPRSEARRRGDPADLHHHLVRAGRGVRRRRRRCSSMRPAHLVHGRGQVAARITSRTRAIMPVHIYGHPVDMEPLLGAGASSTDWRSSRTRPRRTARAYTGPALRSGWVISSCFSFYANKIITTGEGGMVLTDDAGWPSEPARLRNLCFQPRAPLLSRRAGRQLPDDQPAGGARTGATGADRRARGAQARDGSALHRALAGTSGLQLPVEEPWATNVYWMYGLVLDEATGMDAVAFARRLKALGVKNGLSSWGCTSSRRCG